MLNKVKEFLPLVPLVALLTGVILAFASLQSDVRSISEKQDRQGEILVDIKNWMDGQTAIINTSVTRISVVEALLKRKQ